MSQIQVLQQVIGASALFRTEASKIDCVALPKQAVVDEDSDMPLPRPFKFYCLMAHFVYAANYTVVLPTVEAYSSSLGAGPWFAGVLVASQIGPSVVMVLLAPKMVAGGYKPLFFFNALLCTIGNVMYALGQPSNSIWMPFFGQLIRGTLSGAPMYFAYQHALNTCASKQHRTTVMALLSNIANMGMGLGPPLAALLNRADVQLGPLHFNAFTNAGWFFALLWFILLGALVCIKEPKQLFSTGSGTDLESLQSGLGSRSEWRLIAWSVLCLSIASAAVSIWETSAVSITQHKFGWSIAASGLYIGAVFLSGMLGGEALRALLHCIREADILISSIGVLLLSSLMLYWYVPEGVKLSHGQMALAEIPYVVGSVLVLNAAGSARAYGTTIANRSAVTRPKQAISMAVSICNALGRSVGALAGMVAASTPGGANTSAALISALAFVTLSGLIMPRFVVELRNA